MKLTCAGIREWKTEQGELTNTPTGFVIKLDDPTGEQMSVLRDTHFIMVNYFPVGGGTSNVEVDVTYKCGRLPIIRTAFICDVTEMEHSVNAILAEMCKGRTQLAWNQILERNYDKSEMAVMFGIDWRYRSHDPALPQDWLDSFADWAKTKNSEVTYDMIRMTTWWVYEEGSIFGRPESCCFEVIQLMRQYGA